MNKKFIRIGSLMALLGVVLGAFGAHALKNSIEIAQLGTFETGVRYQFYHSLGIFLVAILLKDQPNKLLSLAGWLFLAGILFFSGSLYLLACREVLHIEHWKFLGPMTPIGGFFFITGWALIFFSTLKSKT